MIGGYGPTRGGDEGRLGADAVTAEVCAPGTGDARMPGLARGEVGVLRSAMLSAVVMGKGHTTDKHVAKKKGKTKYGSLLCSDPSHPA